MKARPCTFHLLQVLCTLQCSGRGREPLASWEGAELVPGDDSTTGNHPSLSDGCGKGALVVSSPFQLSHHESGSKKYNFKGKVSVSG